MIHQKHSGTPRSTGFTHVLQHSEGELHISDLSSGRRRIELVPRLPGVYLPRSACETTYSIELITQLLSLSGFSWLCDHIARDEDGDGVQKAMEIGMFSFVRKEAFRGCRLLDFGCGSGASSAILGRMLPDTEVIGVELTAELLAFANALVRHHRLSNVRFFASPCGTALPEGLPAFDFINLSAVYEHLLPREREELMPRMWAKLAPGGVLFINQTPHRYFPIELHSTGLPFINYLPDRLAQWAAVHLAGYKSTINKSPHWEDHLRGGIRGGTEHEIIRNLCRHSPAEPVILQPLVQGVRDRVDLWFHSLNPERYRKTKRVLKVVLKLIYRMSGTVLAPQLSLAVLKREGAP
jgi:SAM-dependent methyltransferase